MQGNRKFIVPINSSQCNDAGFFPRRHLSEAWGKKRGGRALIRRKVVEGRRESLGRAAWPQAHPSNSQLHPSSIRATFLLSFHLQLAMSSSSICYYQLPTIFKEGPVLSKSNPPPSTPSSSTFCLLSTHPLCNL